MNILTREAKRRQAVVKCAEKKGKSYASRKYGVSLSSVKRWCKRYDGSWQSLREKSHRPHKHPNAHTKEEESLIRECFLVLFHRYGWDGVYDSAVKLGYTRSYCGMIYAAKRMGLLHKKKKVKKSRKHDRQFPEALIPGELVQIDVKEVPYHCMRGEALQNGRRFYQWTALDACTRVRFIYGFEGHTQENSVEFLRMLEQVFPFPIQKIQTDNGVEFTYKYFSNNKQSPFEIELDRKGIEHHLIPPRTPWHNGKVERSHRNDQRYFYDWETFRSLNELNRKLRTHLRWSNNKRMRTLGQKSPLQILRTKLKTMINEF